MEKQKQILRRFETDGFGREARRISLDGQPCLGYAITILEQAPNSDRRKIRWARNYVDNFLITQVNSRLNTYHVINVRRYFSKTGIILPKTIKRLKDYINEHDNPSEGTYHFRGTQYSFKNTLRSECNIDNQGYLDPRSDPKKRIENDRE